MSTVTTVITDYQNGTVRINYDANIAYGDLITTNTVLKTDRVTFFGFSNVIVGNAEIGANVAGYFPVFTPGEDITFTHLLSGVGLTTSITRDAYFMRTDPSYAPELDPRIPRHIVSTIDFYPDDTELMLNDLTNIVNPTTQQLINDDITATYLSVLDNGSVQVSDLVLVGNITAESNVRVRWVGVGNTYVGTTKPLTTYAGNVVYFQSANQPRLRIGSEVITYANIAVGKSAVSDIVRNISNTQVSSDWIWTAPNTVSILGSVTQ
jgi:hypothetical protein